jgi:protein-tyrosine phosphatase
VLGPLVDAGCLVQITAGSLCGAFGGNCQRLAERLVVDGLVHFVASDGHGSALRQPVMRSAYERVVELAGVEAATDLCSRNPVLVAAGHAVCAGRRRTQLRRRSWWPWKSVA